MKTADGGAGGAMYLLLARLVAALHIAFALFAILGGLLVARFSWLLWPHLTAFIWSMGTLALDWGCPVTPLEKWLRSRAGAPTYEEGFVQHYLTRTSYSREAARRLHIVLALALLILNILVYHFAAGLI